MMTENLPYSEGTVFAVPLRSGGFARGVVARASPKGAVLFGFFFGPKLSSLEDADLAGVEPEAAVTQMIFGDLGLVNGAWHIIGPLPEWERELWGMPDFVRRDPIGKRAWRVRRLDSDPSVIDSEEPVNFDTNLPPNLSSAYGAVELKLTEIL
jgi:Immunity protein 26